MFRPKDGVVRLHEPKRSSISYTKGGVAKIRDTYPEDWERRRLEVLARDGYRCRKCNANLRGTNQRGVHHVEHLGQRGSNRLVNLVSLCKDCHDKEHR